MSKENKNYTTSKPKKNGELQIVKISTIVVNNDTANHYIFFIDYNGELQCELRYNHLD